MIEEIERKALLEIESLKRDKNELIRRLNEEIRLHADEKRRRVWCENELKRMMAFLEQQGVKVGPIQYPQWYFQQSAPQQGQQGLGQQTYVVGGDFSHTQNSGFGQPGQSRLVQPNAQGQVYDQRPFSPNVHEPNSPSFASQNQTQVIDPQTNGLYVQGQQIPIYQPGQQYYGVQGQQNLGQSNLQYPPQQGFMPQSPTQTYQSQNPNQASQHTNVNQSAFNQQMGQSVQRPPQQISSTYQIGGVSSGNIPQQAMDGSYHDPYAQRTQQGTVGGFAFNPQTGQY